MVWALLCISATSLISLAVRRLPEDGRCGLLCIYRKEIQLDPSYWTGIRDTETVQDINAVCCSSPCVAVHLLLANGSEFHS